jgi:hypothetical protein
MPWIRATAAIEVSGNKDSKTILRFSSIVRRIRLDGPGVTHESSGEVIDLSVKISVHLFLSGQLLCIDL